MQGSLVGFRALEDSGAEGRELGISGDLHDTRAEPNVVWPGIIVTSLLQTTAVT